MTAHLPPLRTNKTCRDANPHRRFLISRQAIVAPTFIAALTRANGSISAGSNPARLSTIEHTLGSKNLAHDRDRAHRVDLFPRQLYPKLRFERQDEIHACQTIPLRRITRRSVIRSIEISKVDEKTCATRPTCAPYSTHQHNARSMLTYSKPHSRSRAAAARPKRVF